MPNLPQFAENTSILDGPPLRLFEGDVVAEFHPETGGLDAGVRQHADEDDLLDSVLFKLLVEVSISKAALRPVLLDDDVSPLRDKVRMPVTAPSTLREDLVLSPKVLNSASSLEKSVYRVRQTGGHCCL
jgi:hypothetical protein